MQWISQNTEEKLLYCTHGHINVWTHLISLFYYSQLQDRLFFGFINPVVDSVDEDDDIFEPERGFLMFSIFLWISGA